MAVCPECSVVISRGGPEVIACVKCGNLFHLTCANVGIAKKTFDQLKKGQIDYVCKGCSTSTTSATYAAVNTNPVANCEISDSRDVENENAVPFTPTSINAPALPLEFVEILRKVVSEAQSEILTRFSEFETRQQDFNEKLNSTLLEIKTDLSNNTRRIDSLEAGSKVQIEEICTVQKKVKDLKAKVVALEHAQNVNDQAALHTTLEIHGLPMKPNEDLMDNAESIARALDVPFSKNEVVNLYRIMKAPSLTQPTTPPIIVVKFSRQDLRDKMIERRKIKRDFSTSNIGWTGNEKCFIYLREALTPLNRKIYAIALGLRREKKIKYLWISGGRIFCRKEDGSPRIHLVNLLSLEGLQ